MPRILPVQNEAANDRQLQILNNVQKAMGGVPNLISTLAQSSAAASAYLAFNNALSQGSLEPKLRERIALVVGETNSCDYCLSAHTMLGAKAGLSADELIKARRGTSEDPKMASAVAFSRKLVADRGLVTDLDVTNLRDHGFTDGDIAEIVAHTALNIFTNYFNHVAGTEVDFPLAPKLEACSCSH